MITTECKRLGNGEYLLKIKADGGTLMTLILNKEQADKIATDILAGQSSEERLDFYNPLKEF